MWQEWVSALVDWLYPPRCPVCRKEVGIHGQWCSACFSEVWCVREVNVALGKLTYLKGAQTICHYREGVRKIMQRLKFQGRRRYARHLRWLVERAEADLWVAAPGTIVVPVPLHPKRQSERGYNQVEKIFQPWVEAKRLEWCDVLLRVRPTEPQWELDKEQRRSNLKGAFAVSRPELVAGRRILLVDDILTTGATINECAKVLRRAGAESVYALTVASR